MSSLWTDVSPALAGATAAVALLLTAGIGAFITATPSHANAGPLNQVLKAPGLDVTPASDPSTLAAERDDALSAAASQVERERAAWVLANHHRWSSAAAKSIETEAERLRNLSTFQWPTEGEVGSGFGWRIHPILRYRKFHDGADIGGACNNPIYAAQSGTVVRTGTGYSGGSGNNVRIDHGPIEGHNIQTGYLHMTRFIVKVGQRVDKGQLIGYVGSTGLSTACHLHLSLYKDGVGSDPLEYVKK